MLVVQILLRPTIMTFGTSDRAPQPARQHEAELPDQRCARLEWLGDRILDMHVALHRVRRYPNGLVSLCQVGFVVWSQYLALILADALYPFLDHEGSACFQ